MAGQPLISIAGNPIPDPSEYTANTATIVNSARNSEGIMIGQVIRDDVAKVSCTWRFISVRDWAAILTDFNISFIQSVEFFNQSTGTWVTRQMYVSDRSAKIFKRDENGDIIGYLNAKLSLIEV